MAKYTDKELQDIVERDVPGYTTVATEMLADVDATRTAPSRADAVGDDLATLRSKYSKVPRTFDSTSIPSTTAAVDYAVAGSGDIGEIVRSVPKSRADGGKKAATDKTVVVRDGRVVAEQG